MIATWRTVALATILALTAIGLPAAAEEGIHLENGPADEHGCRSLELWNADSLIRTFAAEFTDTTDLSGANPDPCSRLAKTEWLGDVLFFDWLGPNVFHDLNSFWTRSGTLWASDGTEAETVDVADLTWSQGNFSGEERMWFRIARAMFVYSDSWIDLCGPFPCETTLAATTGAVPAIVLPVGRPAELTALHGRLFMAADRGATGRELYVSDGTVPGTRLVRDIRPRRFGSWPQSLVVLADRILFTADDGIHGRELWMTGGRSRGTTLVKDIRQGREGSGIQQFWLEISRDPIWFIADDGAHGREVWVTDGTPRGTHLFKDIWPGPHGSGIVPSLAALEGQRYFIAGDPVHGRELWVTDETVTGTHILKDVWPGRHGSGIKSLRSDGTTLCFLASDGSGGPHTWDEWVSDGTTAGTRMGSCPFPGGSRGGR